MRYSTHCYSDTQTMILRIIFNDNNNNPPILTQAEMEEIHQISHNIQNGINVRQNI